ncbi:MULTISPECIES: BrxE family protein [unclassified Endozoicomonas]|uniref:BrxE family protein n=1 Tax=unclassified Endozoicomonas TaxID=2644528 RepID=UPI00214891D3|nr:MULTISPECIES: BrxE family protein [unclassified Endozoicomonas]WOG28772.1 BrxE family protein [Endozoicomonas sp. 8E]
MNKQAKYLIAELKLLIGFLGEKSQFNWWESNFLSSSSNAYLTPTYPRTILLAQYHGVSEAALAVHDRFIGTGINYHLYRLPDSIEREIATAVQELSSSAHLRSTLISIDTALSRLAELASQEEAEDGPVDIGSFSDADLEQLIKSSAGYYADAFTQGITCYPFMRGANDAG